MTKKFYLVNNYEIKRPPGSNSNKLIYKAIDKKHHTKYKSIIWNNCQWTTQKLKFFKQKKI